MTARRWTAIAAAVVLILVGSAGALWFWAFHEPERPLETGWEAVVVTIAGGDVPGASSDSPYGVRLVDPFGIAATPDGTIYIADGADARRI